jgi:hypothetical protein
VVGAETAKMALLLLTGATPPQKLVEVFSNKIAFDWRQMQRWGHQRVRPSTGQQD